MDNIIKVTNKDKFFGTRASAKCLYRQSPENANLRKDLLPVICRTPRVTYASQIRVGEKYYIDRTTLYIDIDGDAYATVLREDGSEVGNMLLSHFTGMMSSI